MASHRNASMESRNTLSLQGRKVQKVGEDIRFVVDFFDVLLPCRQYEIAHKVTETGAVSLVTEFVLRLLHSVEEIDEPAIAEFFGFSEREMGFVMGEVTSHDYVSRSNGVVALTSTGRALFTSDKGTPQIFSVTPATVLQGFDLIDFETQEFSAISEFERRLSEVPLPDITAVAAGVVHASRSFKRNFSEIAGKMDRDGSRNLSLYSIDQISAERRFSVTVPVYLRSSTARPWDVEPDLSAWRNMHELEDRPRIAAAVAAYVEKMKATSRSDDRDAYSLLLKFAPEFLDDFKVREGLSVERYFGVAAARVGELRRDRPTVPLLGTLFTAENRERVNSALEYALKRVGTEKRPHELMWLAPRVHWGLTRVLPEMLEYVEKQLPGEEEDDRETVYRKVLITRDRVPFHLKDLFGESVELPEDDSLPPTLELLWIPRLMAAALVHAPIKASYGVPIPLGILSFDESVVERIGEVLRQRVGEAVNQG